MTSVGFTQMYVDINFLKKGKKKTVSIIVAETKQMKNVIEKLRSILEHLKLCKSGSSTSQGYLQNLQTFECVVCKKKFRDRVIKERHKERVQKGTIRQVWFH